MTKPAKTEEERKQRKLESQARYRRKNWEKRAAASAAWRRANPTKVAVSQAEYRAAHREKAKASVKDWRYKHRHDESYKRRHRKNGNDRHARKMGNGGNLSANIFDVLFEEQDGRCAYCFANLSESGWDLDHYMPLKLGGRNVDDNVQLTCQSCNRSKGAKHPLVFLAEVCGPLALET